MTNLYSIRHKQILLFKPEEGNFAPNALKGFIYYLRSAGKKGIIDFAFSSSLDSIHSNLSIKQNLILEAVTTSLIKNSDENLLDKINNLKNDHLTGLIGLLGNLERQVGQLQCWEVKLTSIVKALLSSSEYIFLERPEQDLGSEQVTLVKKCLDHEASVNGRQVFISSNDPEVWLDVATDIVEKDPQQKYTRTKNPLGQQTQRVQRQNQLAAPAFSILKKAS